MDDLQELCQHKPAVIEIAADWEQLDQARELLISHGYVEHEEEEEGEEEEGEEEEGEGEEDLKKDELREDDHPSIVFHLDLTTGSSLPNTYVQLPEKNPCDPQYHAKSNKRTSTAAAATEWTELMCFQHDTSVIPKESQIRIIAQTIKLKDLEQTVGIKMVIVPTVMLNNAHFNVKLSVRRLVVGVGTSSFLNGKKHDNMGFYPYSIRIDMEPLVDGISNLCAIPVFDYLSLQHSSLPSSSSTSFERTTNGSVGVQVGNGYFVPGSLNMTHSWGTKVGETNPKRTEVVILNEAESGNAASFEWSIIRWKSNDMYDASRQDRGFKWKKGNKELPFNGAAVSIDQEIPDIHWRFEREVREKMVSFRIRLQIEMHLMWWWQKNPFVKACDSRAIAFGYQNQWQLKHRS